MDVVEANDRHCVVVRIFKTVIRRLEGVLAGSPDSMIQPPEQKWRNMVARR